MQYILRPDAATVLEQLKSIKVDAARTILTMVELTFAAPFEERDEPVAYLIAARTDSYRLVVERIKMEVEVEEADSDTDFRHIQPVTILVEQDQLSAAIKGSREFMKPYADPLRKVRLILEGEGVEQKLIVQGYHQDAPRFTLPTADMAYPNWEKLITGPTFWNDERRKEQGRYTVDGIKNAAENGNAIEMPAFKAEYISDIPKFMGTTKRQRDKFTPIQTTHNMNGYYDGAELKPWAFIAKSEDIGVEITYVLMPVRL